MKKKIYESLSTWEFKHPIIPRRKRSCLESPPSVDKHGVGEERRDEDPPDEKGLGYRKALNLVEKIKQRFHDQEHVYKRFLQQMFIIKQTRPRTRDMNDYYKLFSPLFVDDPDLVEELVNFYRDLAATSQQKPSGQNQEVSAQKQCRDGKDATSTEHPDHEDNKRLKKKKYLFDLNLPPDEEESQIVGGDVKQRVTLEDENKEHCHEVEIDKKTEDFLDKYSGKTIYELDLSGCEQCTPSYRRLPENYRTILASQRSNPGALVLNDHCVSIEPGSEGDSFKHISNNKYEKNLFTCEDKRFELDMLLENFKSSVTCVETLLNLIIEDKIRVNGLIQLEDYFTTMNLRCIERLYGDHCLQVIDFLRQTPALALPVILTRLKRRQEEWLKCRAEFNVTWAEICAENDYMAREHRSMYFKENDIKKLSAKSLIADIKELKDKRRKEDVHQPIWPHLKFKYNDGSIHKDLRKLLHIQCKEMFSSEQHNRIMRLWSNFLEKFLGFYEEDPVVSSIERNQNILKVNTDDQRCHKDAEEEDMDDVFRAQHGNGSVPVEGMIMAERLSNVKLQKSYKNAEINRKAAPTCLEHGSYLIKPCAKYKPTMEEKKRDSHIFFGNDDFYVLFRLHQTLYERILLAKRKSAVADKKSKDSGSLDSYARFMSILCDFLKGTADNTKFEDECLKIIGNSSYMLFTLDFLIGKLVKRLEDVEKNEKDNKLLEIYGYKKSSKHWYEIDTVHHKMATRMLHGRNIYRFECSSSPTRLSIELIDKDAENAVING